MNHYCSAEEKMKCIYKCCKGLIDILARGGCTVSADTMIPSLTIIILKAKVPYLISNLQYLIYAAQIDNPH
jgi:hypothetical protein